MDKCGFDVEDGNLDPELSREETEERVRALARELFKQGPKPRNKAA